MAVAATQLAAGGLLLRIDAHHHLWRYSAEEYGWIEGSMGALRRDFLLPEFEQEMRAARVDGAIAVQARQTEEETSWLLGMAAESESLRGVVGWLPIADRGFGKLLEDAARSPKLVGLRHVVQAEADGFLDDADFNHGIALLQGAGLTYDLLIYPRQLREASRFVDRHPDQLFVLNHAAKPEIRNSLLQPWKDDIRELARRPNVFCKVSGLVTEANWDTWTAPQCRPYYDVLLQEFGPQRLMVGSDWPVLTLASSYTRWWQTVETWTAELTKQERAAILGGTTMTAYRL